jgi:hypothetical protein
LGARVHRLLIAWTTFTAPGEPPTPARPIVAIRLVQAAERLIGGGEDHRVDPWPNMPSETLSSRASHLPGVPPSVAAHHFARVLEHEQHCAFVWPPLGEGLRPLAARSVPRSRSNVSAGAYPVAEPPGAARVRVAGWRNQRPRKARGVPEGPNGVPEVFRDHSTTSKSKNHETAD